MRVYLSTNRLNKYFRENEILFYDHPPTSQHESLLTTVVDPIWLASIMRPSLEIDGPDLTGQHALVQRYCASRS